MPGSAGLDAGTQVESGVYIGYRLGWFASDTIHDRNGNELPITGFDLDAYANVLGVAATTELDGLSLSAAVSAPLAGLSLSADIPEASVDRLGLGDIFIEPLKVGRRSTRFDAVAAYALYVPTTQGATSMVGQPQWSHQLSLGGTLFFDDARGWRLSALASYLHNQKKRHVDITRGDTLQLQGGAGGPIHAGIDVGVAGYAVWQVTDDVGSDLPAPLRGARERAFGIGPEINVMIPWLRSRVGARFEWDLDGKARPVGTILVVGVSYVLWRNPVSSP